MVSLCGLRGGIYIHIPSKDTGRRQVSTTITTFPTAATTTATIKMGL
jgi:hypothetical protein